MSHTPIPTPIPRESGIMVVCDGCLTCIKISRDNEIPIGWNKVYIEGWIGPFHACSGKCEERIISARQIKTSL